MATKEDIKKLRLFLNTNKRIKSGMRMPKHIAIIVEELCAIYEEKYDL